LSQLLSFLEEEYNDESTNINEDDNETELDRGADEVLKEILIVMLPLLLKTNVI
jgi:hypothetical protein